MLRAYVSGISVKAIKILTEALNQALGEGVYQIEEVGKNMLKSTVRFSKKNANVVLVVLDSVATDLCKDVENGLYSSNKFFTYTNDVDFTMFLNNTFGLNLEIPEADEEQNKLEEEDIKSDEPYDESPLIEDYKKKLSSKDFIIKNLRIRLKDMQSRLDSPDMFSSESDEECESLRGEIISLKNDLLSANSRIESLTDENSKLKNQKPAISESDHNTVVEELAKLRSSYSIQASVLASKEDKLDEAKKKLEEYKEKVTELDDSVKNLSSRLAQSDKDLESVRVELSVKDRDLVRYLKELAELKDSQVSSDALDAANNTISSLQEEIRGISDENETLQKKLVECENTYADLKSEQERVNQEKQKLGDRIKELEDRITDDNDTIAQLNKDKIDLQSKLEVFEKVSADGDPEEIYDELMEARRELAEVKDGVFGKIASMSLPSSALRIQLIPGGSTGLKLNNVRFIFAGSTGSRKGAYRCLFNELRSVQASNKASFLIVDLVSETSVDYVFEITKVVPGLDWFIKGGSVQTYLSKTVLKNVDVLSPGLRYINDSYFLSVDWGKRMQELENSGYQVFVFCGDISNLVGRIFHESFAGIGKSVIYVQGNAVGARSLVTNLRGLTNGDKSAIGYFDYNPSVKRFVEEVGRTNKYVIINTQKR